MMTKTGGSRFNPDDPFVYFIASNVDRQQWGQRTHKNVLVAVNEVGPEDLPKVQGWIDNGRNVFIDSGVYSLAMRHAEKYGMSHDAALALAPEDVDGFPELYQRYIDIMKTVGDDTWGYIEIDFGGRDNKIKTRAKLEAQGLRPIPVYHPFADGLDYFDYLADTYDRICFGNVVQADRATRIRLVATAWERKRRKPNLWIHLLGLTPNEWLNAFPISSGDSSSWLSAIRWSGYIERTDGRTMGALPKNFQYVLGSDPTSEVGSQKAVKMSAYGSYLMQRNWRKHMLDLEALGCDPFPAPTSPPQIKSNPS